MTDAEVVAKLVHDVGKYVARVARNVADDRPFDAALRPLLIRDLYDLPRGGTALEIFEELALNCPPNVQLSSAREDLRAIAELERAIRSGDDEACRSACRHARRVEAALRAYAKETAR